MKLGEIIKRVDLFIPSPYSDDEKTGFINSAIEGLKRFAGETDIFSFTASGLSIYPLPGYITGEVIISVSVNGQTLSCGDFSTDTDSFFYLLPTGFIGFSEKPKDGSQIDIIYYSLSAAKARAEFETDADFLAQEIYLDAEYLPLLAVGAAADIAAATEDISLSNNLRAEYNRLYAEGVQGHYRKRGRYPLTRAVI